ncbi:LlaJI family restriction endonuclease [Bifidobacterium parmae]|uniref:LlaJI family restriction endonuclease n=1 Tax=Bifidobacterium parmae TaxID=361854 RepID=A0A2N5J4P0_9BIFI|nr:LlaJI family restriction endonuclease [Bifidobacterium parmae]PLS29182.1 LlaJI family restriction endonuclease [Bifidobacterium parmae]
MIKRFFIEGVHYSPEQIRDAWVVGDSHTTESSTTSTDANAKTAHSDDVVALLTSMNIGEKPLLESKKNGYRFNYVGVIAAGGYIFPILPKYYTYAPTEPIPADIASRMLVEALAAIRQYLRKKPKDRDELSFNPVKSSTPIVQNRLGLYRFLLEDFAQHGPYTSTRRIREFNGEGDIDWPRTINQIMPVLSRDDPAYMELVTSRRTRESSNFIARIQLAMLTEISVFIEGTGLNDILRMPLFNQSRESLDDLGETEMLVRKLRQELNTQFETRKKLLLRNMINYFDDRSPADKSTVTAEGTGSFNLVWEDTCKTIFHNADLKLPKPQWEFLPELEWMINDHPGDDDTDNTTVKDNETQEKQADEETNTTATNTLIPDVVNQDEKEDKSVLYILDAKYYMPTYERKSPSKSDSQDPDNDSKGSDKSTGRIAHQPGIGDIIKQYFYMLALQRGLKLEDKPGDGADDDDKAKSKKTITIAGNAFILPSQRKLSDDDSPRHLLVQRGRVSLAFMDSFEDGRSPYMPDSILLYEMDAEQALRLYLDGTTSTQTALDYLHHMFPKPGTDTMTTRKPQAVKAWTSEPADHKQRSGHHA